MISKRSGNVGIVNYETHLWISKTRTPFKLPASWTWGPGFFDLLIIKYTTTPLTLTFSFFFFFTSSNMTGCPQRQQGLNRVPSPAPNTFFCIISYIFTRPMKGHWRRARVNTSQRRPMTANEGQRIPYLTKPTKANANHRGLTQGKVDQRGPGEDKRDGMPVTTAAPGTFFSLYILYY